GRSAVLEVLAGELLLVVARRQAVVLAHLPVGLEQQDVLVLAAGVGLGERLELGEAGDGVGVGRQREAGEVQAEADVVRRVVPLCVVVGEEVRLVAHDRAAERRAVLVVVVGALGAFGDRDLVGVAVLVEALVTVVVEQ